MAHGQNAPGCEPLTPLLDSVSYLDACGNQPDFFLILYIRVVVVGNKFVIAYSLRLLKFKFKFIFHQK